MGASDSNFDPEVEKALLKWPNVPAAYGWLGLDRRGRWLLQSAAVSHRGAIGFLNRNYACDNGQWFVQNGPQRAYCDLDYAPWILSLNGAGELVTHTGKVCREPSELVFDDDGNVSVLTEHGLGLVDDRNLVAFSDALVTADPDGLTLETILERAQDKPQAVIFDCHHLPLTRCPASQLPKRYGFERAPRARES